MTVRSDALPRVSLAFLFVLLADGTLAAQDPPVCHMIATGGTIAMKIDPAKNAPVPALSGEDLLASVPELTKVAGSESRTSSTFHPITSILNDGFRFRPLR